MRNWNLNSSSTLYLRNYLTFLASPPVKQEEMAFLYECGGSEMQLDK